MKTIYACSTPSPTPSPSPSPTYYNAGFNPCNSIKVKTIPSLFSNNLANGNAYNSDCSQGSSKNSQFFYYVPALSGEVNVTTCGLTTMDTIINVYSSSDCQNLGECIASNDDGCADPTQSQSNISLEVVAGVPYYFEVRTYGNSPPAPYSISFY